jgi:hypothetical protein
MAGRNDLLNEPIANSRKNRYGIPMPQAQIDPSKGMAPNWTLEQIANNLFEQTYPIRQSLVGQSTDFLKGGMNPMETPEYAAIRQYADQQANTAKDSILETMPNGGTLLDKLADVDIGKARTLTDASAGIYGDNLSRAMTLATGSTQAAIGARAGADQLKAAREAADAQRDSATKMAVGEGIGGIAGGK